MERACQYNEAVVCDSKECYHCGWDPEVAQSRLEEITSIKLYRIPFTGYCELWAKSPEEAADKAEDIEQQFFAHYEYGEPVSANKEDENELD
jgi:hypothetical protein